MRFTYPKPDLNFLHEFKEWMKNKRYAVSSVSDYNFALRQIMKETTKQTMRKHLGNKDLPGLSRKVIAYRLYLKFLYKEKKAITSEAYQDAIDEYFKPPKRRKNHQSSQKWSESKEKWSGIIRKAPNKIAKMGMWIGFHFGLRRGEIIHLRVQDIDFQNQEVLICIHKKTKNQEFWHPKYERERSIFFTEEQASTLKRWIEEERPSDLSQPYLLWNERGKRKNLGIIGRTFSKWCSLAGITPHVLRYSFATHYYEVSKDIKWVSDLLGHASTDTTVEYLQLGRKATKEKSQRYFNL